MKIKTSLMIPIISGILKVFYVSVFFSRNIKVMFLNFIDTFIITGMAFIILSLDKMLSFTITYNKFRGKDEEKE